MRRRRLRPPLWTFGLVCVLALIGAFLLPGLDRARVRAARAAWLQTGERPPAPRAESGKTRAFQENN